MGKWKEIEISETKRRLKEEGEVLLGPVFSDCMDLNSIYFHFIAAFKLHHVTSIAIEMDNINGYCYSVPLMQLVIVKSGDDCRQEHLAVQLISHFYDIFQEAGLPLWLRPYEVLVTSSYTALIETIPDTASLHSIKSRYPNLSSLREFFAAKYQENSPSFKLAQWQLPSSTCLLPDVLGSGLWKFSRYLQRNFVESMAGYSLVCYLLQVKDRHNGNLLLDEEGHLIHIDFGFMLSNSPGGVNFESAPFKLTRELLEVMDSDAEGVPSEFFDYFKVLCIQGFLTCRKHAERIILLVEMLQDSGYPCFKGGPRAIQNLRKRFHLSLTEEQCVSLVLSLISSSLDAWRTRQYDYYQRVLNGIL
ncbi:Phosphatidylinositol 4-kinase beta 1-like protein [Gossypium australe]|uniref:1-phosphatidylinositol 4-kinase n=1 Tax=Gossypium australe TaxID=47621 RepID=A0A5B6UYV7_9ROSI|nr:Phosphatidylinositol 4-kinase beta 1-like protein [Gossypium australe]